MVSSTKPRHLAQILLSWFNPIGCEIDGSCNVSCNVSVIFNWFTIGDTEFFPLSLIGLAVAYIITNRIANKLVLIFILVQILWKWKWWAREQSFQTRPRRIIEVFPFIFLYLDPKITNRYPPRRIWIYSCEIECRMSFRSLEVEVDVGVFQQFSDNRKHRRIFIIIRLSPVPYRQLQRSPSLGGIDRPFHLLIKFCVDIYAPIGQ